MNNLTPGLILGRDFLAKNQLGITWGPEGVLQLRDNQDVSIQTTEEVTVHSAVTATKVTIPPRSIALVLVRMTLPLCDVKTHFDFVPKQIDHCLGPNCIIYPLDYATIRGGQQKGLQVLVNLGHQEIELQQGVTLGHFEPTSSEEILVTQEDIFGINGESHGPLKKLRRKFSKEMKKVLLLLLQT